MLTATLWLFSFVLIFWGLVEGIKYMQVPCLIYCHNDSSVYCICYGRWEKIKKSTAVIFIRTVCSPFTYRSLTVRSPFTLPSLTVQLPIAPHSLNVHSRSLPFAHRLQPFAHRSLNRSLNVRSTFTHLPSLFVHHSLTVRTSFM